MQNNIGADIMMALDDVVRADASLTTPACSLQRRDAHAHAGTVNIHCVPTGPCAYVFAYLQVSSVAVDAARFEEATHRTIRWIDRCIAVRFPPSSHSCAVV